tara:strand:- start:114 stop:311 length:198 start_codon:yes stop_codon:yes gene_type:complete
MQQRKNNSLQNQKSMLKSETSSLSVFLFFSSWQRSAAFSYLKKKENKKRTVISSVKLRRIYLTNK